MSPAPALLLVEDSETQALQFRRMAEAEGFAVTRTRTAEEALDRLNADLPDLLVVDYRLPGMNGDELVRIVRQTGATRTLPILMLTGDDARDIEARGLDSGASAYVPKAGGRELILSRLRSLLRQRREPAPAPSAAGTASFRAARLLLVGTAPDPALAALLESDGHRVEPVAPADAAATALAEGGIDGVLIDLPPAPAAALCRALDERRQAEGASFEIVALAAEGDDAAVLDGLAAGADDVVPHGRDADMLLLRLRAILRRKLARDEEAAAAVHARQREVALARARAEAGAAEALARANGELAAANQRLQDTQAQLVQSAKMASLGELVAGIAHEINNPLAFILAHQGTVTRLLDGVAPRVAGDPEAAKAVGKAVQRAESMAVGLRRIQELVSNLRRFSRMEEGGAQEVDVPEAIATVLALLTHKLSDRIVVAQDFQAPRILRCSPALLNQVVMNIVGNAADAIQGPGGIRVATRLDGGDYVIEVSDSGPGVPEAIRARIFEPFFTTKPVGAGTGLGLSIAYTVVGAHHGSIAVDDAPGGGARFTVRVPAEGAP